MKKQLTPTDIRNPNRISGYDHVGAHSNGRFHAQVYGGKNTNRAGHAWQGPMRSQAITAALDYCAYINSGGQAPPPRKLKSAGHARSLRRSVSNDPEVQAALGVLRDARGQQEGNQGYVYLIVEDLPGGALVNGKIGYSTNPQARVAELQTGNPRRLKLLYSKAGTPEDEAALHVKYAQQNILQEWFWITGDLLLEWGVSDRVATV